MMHRSQLFSTTALAAGAALFLATLYFVDVRSVAAMARGLGLALPLALIASGLWHLCRTIAWSACFPADRRPPFARLFRVRLGAEAFSFLTIRGVAGEPLKIILLGEVPARQATAAVALERLGYTVVTTAIVGAGALFALVTLPLGGVWVRVFRAMAIGSGSVGVLTVAVLLGRGQYLRAAARAIGRWTGHPVDERPVMRFVLDVERQLLDLARTSPRRLLALLALESACFVCMALEVWVVLAAARRGGAAPGIQGPDGLMAALAIETFTRVTSMLTAFIPGNLGALEASNVAAVSAVGATAAGGALALVRRLRGLWWAGLGLLVYPRPRAEHADGPTLAYIADDRLSDVTPFDRLAGLPIAERVLRAADGCGYGHVWIWTSGPVEALARLARKATPALDVRVIADEAAWNAQIAGARDRPVTLVGPRTVVSKALLTLALETPPAAGEIVAVSAGPQTPDSGVFRCGVARLQRPSALALWLRDRERHASRPSGEEIAKGHALLTVRVRARDELGGAEATIRRATYKGTDPYLARFNRKVSLPISIALIRTPLTANQLSLILVAMGFSAAWLFSQGTYLSMLLAAALSLVASILDGCDGEIARLKYQESAFGCWVETFGDYAYYVAIFVGMTIGVVKYTGMPVFYYIGAAALGSALVSFALLIFLRQRITNGRPERLQTITKAHFYASGSRWAWLVAKISFCATRSSMPYGIFAFALIGLMPAILVIAAIGATTYWISLAIKLRSLLAESKRQALAA